MILQPLRLDAAVPGDVRAARLDLDFGLALADPWFDALSDDERAAAARFHHAADRIRSAATRAALRGELGAALGVPAASLRFVRSERGRPALDVVGDAALPLDFNVAHGGDHALLAWSRVRRVGVDVEPLRQDWNWRPLASLVLGREDARRIAAAPEGKRAALFLAVWTAKEALLKAEGRGIAGELAGFSVLPAEADRGEPPERPRVGGDTALAEALRAFDARWLRGFPGHAACLAWSIP